MLYFLRTLSVQPYKSLMLNIEIYVKEEWRPEKIISLYRGSRKTVRFLPPQFFSVFSLSLSPSLALSLLSFASFLHNQRNKGWALLIYL